VYLSINQVAERFGVSRAPIYEEVKAGRLKAKRIGKKPSIRIHVDDLAEWEKEQDYHHYGR
jgi:excisionase family DNA binding protein